MKILGFIGELVVTAVAALLAATAATWLWNLGVHGTPQVDWSTSARLAILLGVGLPVTRRVARPQRGGSVKEC